MKKIKSGPGRRFSLWLIVIGIVILLVPTPVYAMHIAEGILPAGWAVAWSVVAFIFLVWGVAVIQKRLKADRGLKPLFGLAGAAVFLISVLPIPMPLSGTCSHPCGTPLAAILVGPLVSLVLGAIALLIQALFLAHGGLSTWGANIVSMALMGSCVGFAVFSLARRCGASIFVAGLLAGMLGDWATYATTAFELATALQGNGSTEDLFKVIAIAFAPTQLPLGVLEGIFTGGVAAFLYQRRPELLSHLKLAGRKTAAVKEGVL
jgi:cobalt/nickel transport system permease protein